MECAGKAERRRRFGSEDALVLSNTREDSKAVSALRSATAVHIRRQLSRTLCVFSWCLVAVGLLSLVGCRQKSDSPQQRYQAAKALYEQTTKNLHLPSAAAAGQEQQRLQTEAAQAYTELLTRYPEQDYWCAKALCSLGNIQAAQTNYSAALRSWAEVTTKYPHADWEVLTALKSSADLQWDTGHPAEAKALYQTLITQFDRTNAPAVVRTIVRGSRLKLQASQ